MCLKWRGSRQHGLHQIVVYAGVPSGLGATTCFWKTVGTAFVQSSIAIDLGPVRSLVSSLKSKSRLMKKKMETITCCNRGASEVSVDDVA